MSVKSITAGHAELHQSCSSAGFGYAVIIMVHAILKSVLIIVLKVIWNTVYRVGVREV